MTRISNKRLVVVAGSLLAIAATSSGVAQESAAERYARTLAEADITARYNAQLEQQISSQQERIAALEQDLVELDTTALDVQPMLQRMFDELVQFVENDVPFLKEERDRRIDVLRELMARVDASPSEKFRRLIEAYQIEMEYGRQMAAYRDTLADGRAAEMVRLGRVALLYRVIEGGETGYWDNQQKQWIVDPRSASDIEEALSIAKEERAPDLITVPVPAPQGGRS